jgi:cation transport ATPase
VQHVVDRVATVAVPLIMIAALTVWAVWFAVLMLRPEAAALLPAGAVLGIPRSHMALM